MTVPVFHSIEQVKRILDGQSFAVIKFPSMPQEETDKLAYELEDNGFTVFPEILHETGSLCRVIRHNTIVYRILMSLEECSMEANRELAKLSHLVKTNKYTMLIYPVEDKEPNLVEKN